MRRGFISAMVLMFVALLLAGSIGVVPLNGDANKTPEIAGDENLRSLNDGLVAYWDFDEGSGNILHDKSGNGNDGTIHGATWVNGVRGKALKFDGDSDYVEVPDSESLSIYDSSVSVTLWFYYTDYIEPSNFLIKSHQYTAGYGVDNTDLVFRDNQGNGYTHPFSLKNKKWYFYTGIYDRQEDIVKIYINGQLVGKGLEGIWSASPETGILTIGAGDIPNEGPTGNYFRGILDEVRIYNRALSGEEIHELYVSEGTPTPPKNLVVSKSDNAITITWDRPESSGASNISKYNIYRSTDGGKYVKIATVDSATTSYTDTDVEGGHSYSYYVTAVNSVGESKKSKEINVKFGGTNNFLWFLIILGILAAVIIVVVAVIMKRKRSKGEKEVLMQEQTSQNTIEPQSQHPPMGQSSPPQQPQQSPPPIQQQQQPTQQPPRYGGTAMQSIPVTCPYCGFTAQVPASMRGQTVKCPNCGNAFKIS